MSFLSELLALPVITRKNLGNNHYCYICNGKSLSKSSFYPTDKIAFTVDLTRNKLVCLYLPCYNINVMSQVMLTGTIGLMLDSERVPAYRIPKHLDSLLECKIWLHKLPKYNNIVGLKCAIQTIAVASCKASIPDYTDRWLCENDYEDNAWTNN